MERHASISTILLILTLGLCGWIGCGQQEDASPQKSDTSVAPSAIVATNPAVPPYVPIPKTNITQLMQAFAEAKPEVKERIDDAIQTIEQGNRREGIGKLKLVEADSDLTADQYQAILDTIMASRKTEL